jgi:hypothetical protein
MEITRLALDPLITWRGQFPKATIIGHTECVPPFESHVPSMYIIIGRIITSWGRFNKKCYQNNAKQNTVLHLRSAPASLPTTTQCSFPRILSRHLRLVHLACS